LFIFYCIDKNDELCFLIQFSNIKKVSKILIIYNLNMFCLFFYANV